MKDCENQKESHNINIPLKHGFFPEESNTTSDLQSRSVTWSREGTRRGIVEVTLQNSGQVCIASSLCMGTHSYVATGH